MDDENFYQLYTEITLSENLFARNLSEVELRKQIEILIKGYFLMKNENANLGHKVACITDEVERLRSAETNRQALFMDKYKNEAYSYKCEVDDLKMKMMEIKQKYDKSIFENDKLQEKFVKSKEKQKQLENKKERIEIDLKELDNELKRSKADLYDMQKERVKEVEGLKNSLYKEAERIGLKEKEVQRRDELIRALELKINELKLRNDYLEIISKSSHLPKTLNFEDNHKPYCLDSSKQLSGMLDEQSSTPKNNNNLKGQIVLEGVFGTVDEYKPIVTPTSDASEYIISMKINMKSIQKKNGGMLGNKLNKSSYGCKKVQGGFEDFQQSNVFNEESPDLNIFINPSLVLNDRVIKEIEEELKKYATKRSSEFSNMNEHSHNTGNVFFNSNIQTVSDMTSNSLSINKLNLNAQNYSGVQGTFASEFEDENSTFRQEKSGRPVYTEGDAGDSNSLNGSKMSCESKSDDAYHAISKQQLYEENKLKVDKDFVDYDSDIKF